MISPTDIVDPYLLELTFKSLDASVKPFAEYRVREIKQSYLDSFRTLFIAQFKKYNEENRTDRLNERDIANILTQMETCDFGKFAIFFSLTLRGDRLRVNERWCEIANQVTRLSQAETFNGIILALDAINDSIHNGKETVLIKFDNYKLISAVRKKAKLPARDLLPLASNEVKQIVKRHI